MTIQDFYKDVLTALHCKADDEGYISLIDPEQKSGFRPASVNKKRLVLPTKERLRAGFDSDLQPFHPLAESIARRGTSPVMGFMQRTARATLGLHFIHIAQSLLNVATNPALQKDLPPECTDFLRKVSDADKKTLEAFEKLYIQASKENKLLTIYLKNGGKLNGEKYNRLCVVHFNIIDALNGDDHTVFGVKLRKKDKKTLAALLHHILPFGDDPEYYSAGTNSKIAPYFVAFMEAYAKVAEQLNKIIVKYGKAINLGLEPIDLTYVKSMKDIGKFYDKVPVLPGNDGSIKEDESEQASVEPKRDVKAPWEESVATPSTAPTRTAPTRPTSTTPAPASGLSMDDFRKQFQAPPPPPPAPMYPPQQQYPGYAPQQVQGGPPVPYWMGGGQPAPQQNVSPFAVALGVGQPQAPQYPGYAPAPYYGGGNGGRL